MVNKEQDTEGILRELYEWREMGRITDREFLTQEISQKSLEAI